MIDGHGVDIKLKRGRRYAPDGKEIILVEIHQPIGFDGKIGLTLTPSGVRKSVEVLERLPS